MSPKNSPNSPFQHRKALGNHGARGFFCLPKREAPNLQTFQNLRVLAPSQVVGNGDFWTIQQYSIPVCSDTKDRSETNSWNNKITFPESMQNTKKMSHHRHCILITREMRRWKWSVLAAIITLMFSPKHQQFVAGSVLHPKTNTEP